MKLDINNYPGSKGGNGVYQWIINHIPKHVHYRELMAGSGKIAWELLQVVEISDYKTIILNDLDTDTCKQLEIRFQSFFKKLSGFVITNKDAMTILNGKDKYSLLVKTILASHLIKLLNPDTFIYLDPPYKFSTRKSNRPLYNHEWTDENHRDFLIEAKRRALGSFVMISHYDCDLYQEYLEDWQTSTFWTVNRAGDPVEEKIWMNYDINDYDLMTTKYIGENFTERQQVKRKLESMVSKFEALSRHEKQAVLERIQK